MRSILRFFWFHIRPFKWWYLLMLSAPIITSFYPFAYNYAVKLFLDAMVSKQGFDYHTIVFPITLFLITQLMLDIAWRVSEVAEWKAEPYVRRSILLKSYDYVQHHSYQFFQNNFTGAISSKIKGLLDGYDKFWAEMHHGLILKVFKTLVNLCALMFINTKLGLFIAVWILFYVPIMSKLSIKLNHLSFIETESRHGLVGQITDKITNIISLLSFSARGRELAKLDHEVSCDFVPKQVRVYKYNFIVQLVGGGFYWIMYGFILFYMIHLRILNEVSIGDFAFVFGITIVVAEDIWQATTALQDFSRSMGDLKSALSVLNVPQQGLDHQTAQSLVIQQPTIAFDQVKFAYDQDKVIFDNLNLKVKAGEKIGIVGQSGAGKSSLVNLLLRYFDRSSGQILIDDQDIATVTQDSLRQAVAVIPQDTLLFHRSLLENIRFGREEASDQEVVIASQKAHIHDFIQQLPDGYQTFVGERGIKLSGGQRQRVAIARAILKNAPILILDEATSALDSETEQQIQDSLNFFIADSQKTVIAIAHRLSTLKHMDRIIVLDQGQIVEQGSHEVLIANQSSLYKKLWDLQAI